MSGDPAQLGHFPPVTPSTNQSNLREQMDMLLENKNAMIYAAGKAIGGAVLHTNWC